MKRYDSYKPTGLKWFSEIPIGWEWRFLSQVAHEQNIKKPAGEMYPVMTLSYGEIKRKANIDAGLVPSNYDNYQMLYRGNIVLRLIDLQNDHTSLRTGLVKETGIITSAYTCIAPIENAAYVRYLLHSYDTRKVFYGYGGGVRQSIGYKAGIENQSAHCGEAEADFCAAGTAQALYIRRSSAWNCRRCRP